MAWIEALVRILVLNLVPLWGFAQEDWTPGTVLVLYWFQTLVSIPVTAALIVFHRRLTHKAGHYSAVPVTDTAGRSFVTNTSFLSGFLTMSIPFVIAHGVFIGFIVGLVWKDAAGGVDYADLRMGAVASLNIMAIGFAFEMLTLRARSFAWIESRANIVMRRTILVHFVIIFGMFAAMFAKREVETFFAVFIGLKLLFEVLGELPEWNPQEASPWVARIMNRIGGPGSDFAADWKKTSAGQRETRQLVERTIESLEAEARNAPPR